MTYVVAATRLYQRRPDGSEVKYKAGDEITSLSPEDLQRHLASGAVVDVVVVEGDPLGGDPDPENAEPDGGGLDDDSGDPDDEDTDEPADDDDSADPAGVKRPPRVANKAALVTWLAEHGDYDEAELNEQNKDQLWELIDATEV